jgi:GGDEF domain-containing protein
VLLIEAADDAAAVFLERLEAELPPGLAISAGAASYPGDATTVEDLLRLADERQYAAKRGRQRIASR